MRFKNCKFIKYIGIMFSFALTFILFNSVKVFAGSTDLYFEDTQLAYSYNINGDANIKNSIYICAHSNKAIYQIDNSQLRISKYTIINGTDEVSYSIDDDNFDTYLSIDNNVTNCTTKKSENVDKVTLKIGDLLKSDNYNNDVKISFEFQRRKYFLGIPVGWTEYDTTVNYIKGSSTSTTNVTYQKTTTAFADDQFKVESITLAGRQSCSIAESDHKCYNLDDLNNKATMSAQLKTSFAVKGTFKIYYEDDEFIDTSTSTYQNLFPRTLGSTILKSSSDKTYIFKKVGISSNVYDKYGTKITSKDVTVNEVKLDVDTIAPKVNKAGVSDDAGSEFYDYAEIFINFNFTEKVTATITGLKVSSDDNTLVEESKELRMNELSNYYNVSYYLSCNGKVELDYFSIIIVDEFGNTTKYTENTALVDNDDVYIRSNIETIDTGKNYFYEGETVIIIVSLKETEDFKYTKAELVGDGNTATFVTGSSTWIYSSSNSTLTLKYLVNDDVFTFNQLKFYVDGENNTKTLSSIGQIDLYFNVYLNLGLNGGSYLIEKGETLTILENEKGLAIDVIDLPNGDLKCVKNANLTVTCEYTKTEDKKEDITIEAGSIVYTDTGLKNNSETFTYTYNQTAPVASIKTISNSIEYNNKYYYNNGTNIIEFEVTDKVYEQLCIHLVIRKNGSEHYKGLRCDTFTVSLPSQEGTYTLTYYSFDGDNVGEIVTTKEFVNINGFLYKDINLMINEQQLKEEANINSEADYNYIKLKFDDLTKLKTFVENVELNIPTIAHFEPVSCDLNNEYCEVPTSQIEKVDEELTLEVTLKDKLGNNITYKTKINVDTIDPVFDNLLIEKSLDNGVYTVKIDGYDGYSIYVEVDGVRKDLDSQDKFTTSEEKYTIYLTDGAGNTSSKVFTNIQPGVELFSTFSNTQIATYEVNISPFDNTLHVIEEFKYLVFDYTTSEISLENLEIARANVCTSGRKTKCFVMNDVDFTYNGNSTINEITLTRGYTYIFDIKVTGERLKTKNTNQQIRLNLGESDLEAPVGGYLDQDTNPDYISSNSSKEFIFKFTASDENLTAKYSYIIVDASLDMNISAFVSKYSTCYGALSSENKCGLIGESTFVNNVGTITISSGNNYKRLLDDTRYALYVLLSDDYNNRSVFKVREFINILTPPTLSYLNDSQEYTTISNGEEIITANSAKIRIEKYDDVDIEEIYINGEKKECVNLCEYDLITGKHTIKVVDVLGNEIGAIVYSGYTGKPIIDVYYNYSEEYFKITDGTLSYSSNNVDKVYLKVTNDDIASIKVKMANEIIYVSGDVIFEELIDENNKYGMNLLDLMTEHHGEAYSGEVIILVTNDNNKETSITLTIDNTVPEITLKAPGSKITLFNQLVDLEYQSGAYYLNFNYQRDLTYLYLMDALLLKVDNITFNEIKNVDRFNFKINGIIFNTYEEVITKGDKVVTLDYFDAAGNEAETITINLTVIDSEKPTISLVEKLETVELNEEVKLAEVIISDNHDDYDDLVLTVKINGTTINHINYKFTELGEFNVVYTLKDTTNNSTNITQTVIVRDTTAPLLKEGTITSYGVGINSLLKFDLPEFIDSDPLASVYKAYAYSLYDYNNNLLNESHASYPIKVEGNKVNVKFNAEYKLGIYKLVFVGKDNQGNASEVIIDLNLTDDTAPVIKVKLNGNDVSDGIETFLPWNSLVILDVHAYDDVEGEITNITTSIKFNGSTVSSIDTSKSGIYTVEYKAIDKNNNISTFTVIIKVEKDETNPVINKVLVNGKELSTDIVNKINIVGAIVNVDASDDSNMFEVSIIINDEINIKNNSEFSLETGIINAQYEIKVVVKDSSGNSVTHTYIIDVDNVLPIINGVDNGIIYNSSVKVTVSDANINNITIYKNNTIINEYSKNIEDIELSDDAIYKVVARDKYGNVETKVFAISTKKEYSIIDEDSVVKNYQYDESLLVEVQVVEGKLKFILDKNITIGGNDQIYILVNYPNSTTHKYIAYSMNGETYLSNNSIIIDTLEVSGVSNEKLLEKIDDKYYAYMMITRNANVGSKSEEPEEKSSVSGVLKTILAIILIAAGLFSVLMLIIKLRRRVRAI